MSRELPPLAARFVERCAPSGGPGSRLEQRGEMWRKPGGRAMRFRAVENLSAERVAFEWRARFAGGLRVVDRFDGHEGELRVGLLGIPLQRAGGPAFSRGEAMRYLAELPFVPQAIRANPELTWREIDAATVEVATVLHDELLAVRFFFDDEGDVVRTEAERPRGDDGNRLTTWIGSYGDYRHFGGVRLPSSAEVAWALEDGLFTYWRARVTGAG